MQKMEQVLSEMGDRAEALGAAGRISPDAPLVLERRQPIALQAAEDFFAFDALIFVGAAGIALRSVAPLLQNKTRDPAVLCADEAGRVCHPPFGGASGRGESAGLPAGSGSWRPGRYHDCLRCGWTDAGGPVGPGDGAVHFRLLEAREIAADLLAGEDVGFLGRVQGPWAENLPKGIFLWREGLPSERGILVDWGPGAFFAF